MRRLVAAVVALMVVGTAMRAQNAQAPSASAILASEQLHAEAGGARITLTSPSVWPDAPLPDVHSDYGERVSPALQWTGVPAAAKSIAVIVEDPDAQEPKPFVHWMLYNLPASLTSLPEALPGVPRLPELHGALQGRNSKGTVGYFGPRPPKGDSAHHYHFQIFAVTEMLSLAPSASRESLLAALQGHVVGRGDLVVTFRAPADAR